MTSFGYSMIRIARLDDFFSEMFELKTNPVEGQSLQQKDEKRSKRKGDKRKLSKPKSLKA